MTLRRGDRVITSEPCGLMNMVPKGMEGVVLKQLDAGSTRVRIDFTRYGLQSVLPTQLVRLFIPSFPSHAIEWDH
jgi:hypothetical protein